MDKATGKETVKNMQHLVRLLHKEWERPGRTKAKVCIDIADRKEAWAKLTAEIQERQEQLGAAGMSFKECMALSKGNFVLLRLARKIKKAGERAGRREDAVSFIVEMDREEYRLFSLLIEAREE